MFLWRSLQIERGIMPNARFYNREKVSPEEQERIDRLTDRMYPRLMRTDTVYDWENGSRISKSHVPDYPVGKVFWFSGLRLRSNEVARIVRVEEGALHYEAVDESTITPEELAYVNEWRKAAPYTPEMAKYLREDGG
jgi:hypothetical protein